MTAISRASRREPVSSPELTRPGSAGWLACGFAASISTPSIGSRGPRTRVRALVRSATGCNHAV
jgi:hypothetical protein